MMRFRDLFRSRLSTSDYVKKLEEVDGRKVDVAEGGIGDLAKDTGKLLLNVLVEVSDALPPLKSAVAGLQIVIEHVEKTGDNKIKMEKLLERVTKIRDIFTTSLTTAMEPTYRQDLQSKLDQIKSKLAPINEQGKAKRFVKASSHATLMEEYIGEVEEALAKYQLSLMMDIHRMGLEHLDYDERAILDKLPRAMDASYKGSDDLPSCLEGTRVDILGALHSWATDSTALQIYWLNGHAGSGKSTIARSLASSLSLSGNLGASFFCSRDSQERSDLKKIFPTIAFQLATAIDSQAAKYRAALLSVLRSHPDIASSSLRNQLDELIVKPATVSELKTIIIIDALDECRDEATTSLILSLLATTITHLPNIKLFITSRPEPHIRLGFRLREMQPITQVMILHEIASTVVNKDIRLFLEKELMKIAAQRSDIAVHQAWPKQHELDALTEQAAGLFIFAATVVKFIGGGGNPRQQLGRILVKADRSARDDVYPSNSFHADVDALYSGILKDAFAVIGNDHLLKHRLRAILGLLVVAYNPLNSATIAEILGIEGSDLVKSSLRWLHSVIFVPEDHSSPLRFHHKSFPDFLSNSTRCQSPDFHINLDNCHFHVAECCLNVLRDRLQKNICGLSRYDLNDDLDSETRDRCIAESTKYSSRHSSDHLLADRKRDEHLHRIASSLRHFLTEQQLLWFEVLALTRDLGLAVSALENVKDWLTLGTTELYTALLDWVHDGRRFILWAFDAIDASAAHIYHSALPFAPETSLIRQHHAADIAFEAEVTGGRTVWDGIIRAVQLGAGYTIKVLQYSHGGTLFAVGAGSEGREGFSRLYRARTGELVASLDSSPVHCVSFSPDDQTVATATDDTVRLWDTRTGGVVTQIICRSGTQVSFHPSLDHLLLLAEETYITIWDVSIGAFSRRFQPPAFREACWVSGNTKPMVLLATTEMELWDLDPPQCIRSFSRPPHDAYGHGITSVASSGDGVFISSGTETGDMRIYRVDSGDLVCHVSDHQDGTYDGNRVTSLQFLSTPSPDVLCLIYRTDNRGVRVFYPGNTGDHLFSLGSSINKSSVFSSDGHSLSIGLKETISIQDLHAYVHSPHRKEDRWRRSLCYAHFSPSGRSIILMSELGYAYKSYVWEISKHKITQGISKASSYDDTVRQFMPILLQDDAHVLYAERKHGAIILWNIDRDDYQYLICRLWGPQVQDRNGPSKADIIGPSYFVTTSYTHRDDKLGFIAVSYLRYRQTTDETKIECWDLDVALHPGNVPKITMSLVAYGTIPVDPRQVVRVTQGRHTDGSLSCITVTIHCVGSKLFTALWKNCDLKTHSGNATEPEALEFVESSTSFNEAPLRVHGPINESLYTYSETPALLSHDTHWISDRQGRRLLWVPPEHRSVKGLWHWKSRKLFLDGQYGNSGFVVVDYSKVDWGADKWEDVVAPPPGIIVSSSP